MNVGLLFYQLILTSLFVAIDLINIR